MITILIMLGVLAYVSVLLYFVGYATGVNKRMNDGKASDGWLFFLAGAWPITLVVGSLVALAWWLLDKGYENAMEEGEK